MAALTEPGTRLAIIPSSFVLGGSGVDVVFTRHQGVDALPGDVVRFALRLALLADIGVVHAGAVEEVGIGRTGLQRSDRDPGVAKLKAKAMGERENEGLGRGVNCLARSDHFGRRSKR